MDKYLVELEKIATAMEEVCGLGIERDGVPVRQLRAEDVMQFCNDNNAKLPRQALKDLNVSVSRQAVKLAYTTSRMHYFNRKKLDFSNIPCLMEIAQTLMFFTQKQELTKEQLVQLDKIIMILSEIDQKDKEQKSTLVYRYLRLFLLLIIYGCYCNAGIVADLLLRQMIVRGS